MTDFKSAIRQELGTLQAELANDPRIRRVKRLQELLADYEGKPANIPLIGTNGRQTKADLIKDAILALMAEKKQSVHRADILLHLTSLGLMGHEKNSMASLAAYLSDWKDTFKSDGNGQWSPKQRNG